jgi:hypothetical protein
MRSTSMLATPPRIERTVAPPGNSMNLSVVASRQRLAILHSPVRKSKSLGLPGAAGG